MKKIGNVIYYDELVNHTNIEYVNYIDMKNGNNNLSDLNTKLPNLFVGWEHFKDELNLYDNVSILEKEIIKNEKYWEFSFNEKKAEHIDGINMFIRNTPHYYFKTKYTYTNLDPIFNKITNIEEFKNVIPKENFTLYQFKDEMIYLLEHNKIFGIDLEMYNYFNINSYEIISLLTSKSSIVKHDIDGSIYQDHYKTYPNFEDLKRYLVVLLTKP